MLKVLGRLVDVFVYTFGITPPRPEQQRVVSLVLGGAIAFAGVAIVAGIIAMLVSVR